MKSKRHFSLFLATSLPLLSFWIFNILEINKTRFRYIFSSEAIRRCLLVFLLVLSAYFFIPSRIISDPFNSYCNQYPCKALEYLKSNMILQDKNLFNMYQWGGYLTWMWPEKKIFIDARFPHAMIRHHTLLEEYHDFFDTSKTSYKLDQYNIDVVLLSKDFTPKLNWYEKILADTQALENEKFSNMYYYLKDDVNWKTEYEDDMSVIFVRKANVQKS